MRGTTSLWITAALVATLILSGCKKGPDSSTASGVAIQEPNPSGMMTVEGMYAYMADAGVFKDCATGVQWPVATEGDNATLEQAYTSAKIEPGSPLLVTVDGRVDMRRKVDAAGKENVLIVERFVRVWPNETCGSMTPVALENVYWAFLELQGKPVITSDAKAPYLELNAAKKSAYGFGGCNRFFGSYEIGKHQMLTFGAIGATRMACPDNGNLEQQLFTVLGQTTRYEIDGSKLLLYSADDLVARLQARDLLKTD